LSPGTASVMAKVLNTGRRPRVGLPGSLAARIVRVTLPA
jgi:hypothetical protein